MICLNKLGESYMENKNLVVGAGFTGAVIARKIAEEFNEDVLVIDRRNVAAGNSYDYRDKETGIMVHKYGPHIFHTNNKEVWDFLSRFTKWHYFFLKPNAVIEGEKVTLPFNLTTIRELFSPNMAVRLEEKLISNYGYGVKVPILNLKENEDKDLKFLAEYIYEHVFKNYTMKQWGLKPEEIDPNVTARVPVYISHDNRYFQDKYQGIPLKGYTKLIENMLEHKNIELKLGVDYKELKAKEFKRIFYTGAIDEFFEYKYGELPYRSLDFDVQILDREYYQKTVVTNYPNNYDFTRITEHKYFLDEKSDKTVISVEYPEKFQLGKNERYYPISNPENQALYEKYRQEAKKYSNLYFCGRLGGYKYYNMDLAVEKALELFKTLI